MPLISGVSALPKGLAWPCDFSPAFHSHPICDLSIEIVEVTANNVFNCLNVMVLLFSGDV